MTGNQILKNFNQTGKLTIKFNNNIEAMNLQWEENMMADITEVYNHNDIIVIAIDSSNYKDFNKSCQKPIWFNHSTMEYNAVRDEFLAYEDEEEDYDDEFYIKTDEIINFFSIV